MTDPTHSVAYQGSGDGPPLVLVHGVGLDHAMWDLVVDALVARPAGPSTIIGYDLLGHGLSADPPGDRSMADFVDQLNQVAANAGAVPDVVGLSLGGAIVRGAASRHPGNFRRVVIANAVFQRTDQQRAANRQRLALTEAEGMGPVADLAIDRWFTPQWQAEFAARATAIHQRLATASLPGYLKAYRVFTEGDPEMPGLLAALANPTLVITGERDYGSTPQMARAMADCLDAGHAKVLPGAGHLPPVECPSLFTDALSHFLEN